jgi:hypothetical protein
MRAGLRILLAKLAATHKMAARCTALETGYCAIGINQAFPDTLHGMAERPEAAASR